MCVPSTKEDGDYAVFLTNRDDVAPEDVRGLCNRYSRRWEIGNGYKQIKKFLPTMASTDYRVRCFNFMFACLMYNVWRLADYLLKLEIGKPIRDEPVLTDGETIELLACFLVPYGQSPSDCSRVRAGSIATALTFTLVFASSPRLLNK